MYVPENDGFQRVHFALGKRDLYDQVAVSIDRDGKSLYLNGGRSMVARLHSSNALFIQLED